MEISKESKGFIGLNSHNQSIWFFSLIIFLVVITRNAWVSDDSYITLRSVLHTLEGLGPVFNAGERVQSYTHPLWFLLLIPVYALTHEAFFTLMVLGLLLSGLAVGIASSRLFGKTIKGSAFLLILAASKAFAEYSTSGLENSLSHLLFAWFAIEWLRVEGGRFKRLVFIGALLILCRHDHLIIVLPPLVLSFFQPFEKRKILQGLVALWPFWLWTAFSIFYYGFAFPNTAYAKLNTGIPQRELWEQGLGYLINSLKVDLVTITLIFLSIVLSLTSSRKKKLLPLLIGVFLYLLYTMRVGGDFMSGRFLTSVFFISAICLVVAWEDNLIALASTFYLFILGLLQPNSPILLNQPEEKPYWEYVDDRGIADERAFYGDSRALLSFYRGVEPKRAEFNKRGGFKTWRDKNCKTNEKVIYKVAIGISGYDSGPCTYICDYVALSDPLLARIPAHYTPNWRVGHYLRTLPEGYKTTLETGKNSLIDSNLKEYYDHLCVITKGPLLSSTRFKEIFAFTFRKYDFLIDKERYRNGGQPWNEFTEIHIPKPEGYPFDGVNTVQIAEGDFVATSFQEKVFPCGFEISLDNNDVYLIQFFSDTKLIWEYWIPKAESVKNLHITSFEFPNFIVEKGFDRIIVKPVDGDKRFAIGHMRLID